MTLPAAAIISDDLAKEVDFFSIGTNDLSQYTMAIDRQNPQLDLFFDPHHPAVLRMISLVMENAHKAGIWLESVENLVLTSHLQKSFWQWEWTSFLFHREVFFHCVRSFWKPMLQIIRREKNVNTAAT